MSDLPSASIDLVRFGYVLKARLDELDLSFAQVARLTGLSMRQLSHAVNGKPVCAGATHVLAVVAGIDLDTMMPAATQERLVRIRRLRTEMREANSEGFQALTLPVPRETCLFALTRAASPPLREGGASAPAGSSPAGAPDRPGTGRESPLKAEAQ